MTLVKSFLDKFDYYDHLSFFSDNHYIVSLFYDLKFPLCNKNSLYLDNQEQLKNMLLSSQKGGLYHYQTVV